MKKTMYSPNPVAETEIVEVNQVALETNKRVRNLEEKVRQLSEQVLKMAAAVSLNSRQIRKQNTDINNVTTAVRSNK